MFCQTMCFFCCMKEEFVSENKRFLKLLSALQMIADSVSPVLIKGERGTGKEYLARKIHEKRHDVCSFVKISCADKSFSSENVTDVSSGTTLFFEEISLLPPDMQNLLGNYKFSPGVKIIASSSCDLEKKVELGKFSKSLFSRLSMVTVNSPALRERSCDIVPLALWYLDYFAQDMGKLIAGFSPSALDALSSYWWPGNIRELRTIIERAVLMCEGNRIELSDLHMESVNSGMFDESEIMNETDRTLKSAMNNFKKRYVLKVLQENGWNKSAAARILDVQRTYVFKIIDDLNIKNESQDL